VCADMPLKGPSLAVRRSRLLSRSVLTLTRLAACIAASSVVLVLTGDVARSSGGLCARVSSPSKVVRDACRAIPQLSRSDVTEVEATTYLRRWAAGWIDTSSERLLIEESYWKQDIDSLYRRFKANDRGVLCAGTAWTLMRLYNAFGLDSWTYNVGIPGGAPLSTLTHVVTLVRAGGTIVVQDAYANYTLTDRTGRPLDIRRVLALLRERRADEVVRRGGKTRKDILLTTDELARIRKAKTEDWPWGPASNLPNCGEIRKGVSRCSVAGVGFHRLRFWLAWNDAMRHLRSEGLPPDFLYLLTYPLGLSSDADGWTPPADSRATPTRALLDELLAALVD
jgi:hypothetical protein